MLNEKFIAIESGRDQGKTFVVREMPASKLEKWSARAMLALFNGNLPSDIAEQARGSNAVALAQAVASGLGGISWELVEPLYDELLGCVYRVPDPSTPNNRVPLNPANVDAHIQDMSTLLRLRAGVLEVCFDFFGRDGGLYSRLTTAADRLTSGTTKPSRPA